MPATSAETGTFPALDQPKAGRMMIQYAPSEASEIAENPPRFSWLPEIDDEAAYMLRISGPEGEQVYSNIRYNFFTPPQTLSAGAHSWSYALCDEAGAQASQWSTPRAFTVAEGLPETPLAPRETRLAPVPAAHPRLWLDAPRIKAFRTALSKDADHCGWQSFMDKSRVFISHSRP